MRAKAVVQQVWLLCAVGGVVLCAGLSYGAEAVAVDNATPYDGHVAVRVLVVDRAGLDVVLEHASVVANCRIGIGSMEAAFDSKGLAALRKAGLGFEVLHPDLGAFTRGQRSEIDAARLLRGADWYGTYRDLGEVDARMDMIAAGAVGVAGAADLVGVFDVGLSLENRMVRGMRISSPGTVQGSKPVVLLQSGQHAREWIGPMTVMYLGETLAGLYSVDARVHRIMDGLEFVVIPVSNPDGYVYSWTTKRYWRKNRRDNGDGTFGVDLNRNWAFGWGGIGSSGSGVSDTYRGTSAFSEPETRIVRDYSIAEAMLVSHVDWHSFSQLILYPYGGIVAQPAVVDQPFFYGTAAGMADAIFQKSGMVYAPMAGHEVFLAAGDSTDWFYGTRGVKSFTMELRPSSGGLSGFAPPASEIRPTAEESFEALLVLSEAICCPYPRVDVTTTDTLPGEVGYGVPDGQVNGADLSFYVEAWLVLAPVSDFTTTNTNPGGPAYGVPDGEVNGADLSYFIEEWLVNI